MLKPSANRDMEIFVEDIPPEGMELRASEADPWLSEMLAEVTDGSFTAGDKASLVVKARRMGDNISIEGSLRFSSHPACDRCLAEFEERSEVPVKVVLAPLYESRRQKEHEEGQEIELVREDLEFSFYEGDRIDLGELVREASLLARPMKRLCSENCKGLCQRCGKDLNQGPCGCSEKAPDPRWAVLKDIDIRIEERDSGSRTPVQKLNPSKKPKPRAKVKIKSKAEIKKKIKTKAKIKTKIKTKTTTTRKVNKAKPKLKTKAKPAPKPGLKSKKKAKSKKAGPKKR